MDHLPDDFEDYSGGYLNETEVGELARMEFWVNGVLHTIISVSGIISNLICITILLCCRQRLNFAPAFANLLTLLSLFYIFTLAITFVNYSAPTLSSHFKAYYSPAVVVNTFPFLQIALSGSSYTLIAIALERYLNVCTTNQTVWHHMWRGWGYVILVIVLAVVFNLNTFFELTYGTYSEIYCAEASGCEGETGSWRIDGLLFLDFTALKKNPIYNSLSIGFKFIDGIVPMIVLPLLSCKTFSTMRTHLKERNSSHRDGAMVDILIGLVFVFIICNTPLIAFTIYEMLFSFISNDNDIMYDGWTATAVQLVNLLVSASHALNIFVFCFQDKMFQALFFCQRAEISGDVCLT